MLIHRRTLFNSPAIRRQTMHIENATTITMGSYRRKESRKQLFVVWTAAASSWELSHTLTVRNFQSFCTRRGVGPSDSSTAKLPRNRSMESWKQRHHQQSLCGLMKSKLTFTDWWAARAAPEVIAVDLLPWCCGNTRLSAPGQWTDKTPAFKQEIMLKVTDLYISTLF